VHVSTTQGPVTAITSSDIELRLPLEVLERAGIKKEGNVRIVSALYKNISRLFSNSSNGR